VNCARPADPSILFLGKADDAYGARALAYCRAHSTRVTACLGTWNDPLPAAARDWSGDYIISYLSRWVVPATLLARARKHAINFHPASPDYPGIGCTNFALYDDVREFGVTCHHMAPRVDTGPIIAVSRFPVRQADTVASLLERTYQHQIALFLQIAALLVAGKELPASDERWTRPPFTRKQFNELFRITPGMDATEIARRVRAVSYQQWRPYVDANS
jgi:methionyl-tRNA formyltransferase